MTQANRLSGGLIDRSATLSFSFDGKTYQGPCRRHAGLCPTGKWRAPDGGVRSNTTARAAC